MQRLVVSALRLHAYLHHLLEGQLDSSLNHCYHQDRVVEVLLLLDHHASCRRLLESSLRGLLPPFQEVDIIVVPVFHHGFGEVACDDVILVLGVEGLHDGLQLLGQLKALHLGRVVEAVHHARDTTVLQRLGDGLPAVLDQLGGIASVNAVRHHLIEAKHRPCLEHATEDGLLAHEIALHLGNEGAEQHASTIAARGGSVSLGNVQSIALGVVLRVHGNQRGNAEATLVLLPDLGAWAFGRHHDNGQVRTDSHALLHDVEPVAVREAGSLLHHRHDRGDHRGVLLVRGEIADKVRSRNELFIGPDLESVLRGVDEALSLLVNGILSQGIADVAARVAHVQALIQALCATADNHNLLLVQLCDAVCELPARHKAAPAELVELLRHGQSVEVVGAPGC
mmetsp:Transcript_37639/g.70199  ORF Transcript_37639/g.70199 Transcript_37639/m.70199 type:complete len:396 (+) Transcript_37639:467-1654(+)